MFSIIKRFFFILVLVFSLTSCESKKSKALDFLHQGKNKLAFSDISGAKADFDNAVKYDPELAEAWYYRGNIWFNMQVSDSAIANYSKAIQLKPDFGDAYSNRARVKFFLGDNNGACEDWLKAEELGVKNLREYTKWCK